ncbi:MAG: threonine ammonia-lyase [Longimicrobiales bacterium]
MTVGTELVTPSSIEEAARGLRGVALRTPIVQAEWLTAPAGAEVALKCENLQRAGAFKIRGAYTMISRLPAAERAQGVITYSSGNHAQAVALAAREFSIPAVVVMPTTAPAVKVAGARAYGAEVVFEGTTSTERQQRALEIAAERGLAVVPPFDHADIIAGQGTVAREILLDWPDAETVLVPVGGGGLIAGVAAWVHRAKPGAKVIGVEPVNADAMHRSLAAGQPTTVDMRESVADGLLPVRPGDLTFAHAQALVDEIVLVEDAAIVEAASRLLHDGRLLVELSGAATVAALLSGAYRPRGRRTVAILSGGNIEPLRAAELLSRDGRNDPFVNIWG